MSLLTSHWVRLFSPRQLVITACLAGRQRTTPGSPPPPCLSGMLTFSQEPPGLEEGSPQWQVGARVFLESCVQPPHQRVDRGVAEAEGGRGEHVGHSGVHGGVVALVRAHVLPKGLGAQDFGDVIPQGDDLWRKESGWSRGGGAAE